MITRPITRPVTSPIARAVNSQFGNVWNPRALFALGEQGFWYDPNDLSTLWQDSAGTTPVTAAGQPVGLMLDKSKGLVLGAEKLTNGDFSAGAAGWTVVGADATHVATFSDGVLRYRSDTTSPQLSVLQSGVLTIGRTYEVTAVCSAWVSGSVKLLETPSVALVVSGAGTFKARITSTSSAFTITRNSANVDLTIDSVSVKELPGNHASIATAASRPILRQNATTGAYYLETDGVDDWMQTNAINFTGTDEVSVFAGVRKLSDAAAFPVILESGTSETDAGSFHLHGNASTITRGYAFAATGSTQVLRRMSADYASPDSSVISAFGNLSESGDAAVAQRRNGAQQGLSLGSGTSTGGGNYGNYPLYLFRRAGTSLPFNGHCYGLIGVGRLTTAAEIANIERMLATRTGVALA